MIKSFVVSDLDSCGSTPVIGVLKNIMDGQLESFYSRLETMLSEHFDAQCQVARNLPLFADNDLVDFPYVDAEVEVDPQVEGEIDKPGVHINIRIYETWIY